MNLEEFISRKNLLQQKLLSEIDKVNNGLSQKNVVQLNSILSELQNCPDCGEKLKYPHIIIDSWDYSDPLGLELLEFAELYTKIQSQL